jgi:hypothetical protein
MIAISSNNKVYVGGVKSFSELTSGSVYVYTADSGTHLNTINPSDDSNWNYFGISVHYQDDVGKLIVGSPYRGYDSDFGGIYIYDSDGSNEIIIEGDSATEYNHGVGIHVVKFGNAIAPIKNQFAVVNNNEGVNFYNYDGSLVRSLDSIEGPTGTIYLGPLNWGFGWSFPSISLSEVQDYQGGTNPISLSEYYSDSVVSSPQIVDWSNVELEDSFRPTILDSAEDFGYSVGMSGNTAIIGSRLDEPTGPIGANYGAVYVLTFPGAADQGSPPPTSGTIQLSNFYDFVKDSVGPSSTWSTQQILQKGKNPASNTNFGWSVDIDGDTIVASAPLATKVGTGGAPSILTAGEVNVYTRLYDSWNYRTSFTASDVAQTDQFGRAVAIDGNTIVASAPFHDLGSGNEGAVYVFTGSQSNWTEQQKLVASDASGQDLLGQENNSVDISGDTIVVGAHSKQTNGVFSAGAAYVFTRNNDSWSQTAKLTAPLGDIGVNDRFGYSVAVDSNSNTIAITATLDDSSGSNEGAIYVFTRSDSTWSQQAKLTRSPASSNGYVGYSIDLEGDTIIVGAPLEDSSATDAGSAYIFTRSDSIWSQSINISNPRPAAGDQFGHSVAISGNRAIIGAPKDGAPVNSGTAFIYVVPDSA